MNKPRFATAKTAFERKAPTFLASIDKATYDMIFSDAIKDVDNKIRSLERIFPKVPKNVLIMICYNFVEQEYSHN